MEKNASLGICVRETYHNDTRKNLPKMVPHRNSLKETTHYYLCICSYDQPQSKCKSNKKCKGQKQAIGRYTTFHYVLNYTAYSYSGCLNTNFPLGGTKLHAPASFIIHAQNFAHDFTLNLSYQHTITHNGGKTFAVLLNKNKSSFHVLKLVGKTFAVYKPQ